MSWHYVQDIMGSRKITCTSEETIDKLAYAVKHAINISPELLRKTKEYIIGKHYLTYKVMRLLKEHHLKNIDSITKKIVKNSKIMHLLSTIDNYDEKLLKHSFNTAAYALVIGSAIEYKNLNELFIGAVLHDTGKLLTSKKILNKSATLTKKEQLIIQKHPADGHHLICKIGIAKPKSAIALMAYQHHEREDGKGYPQLLVGKEMTKAAKIVGISDVIEAMSERTVYQKSTMHLDEICIFLEIYSGIKTSRRTNKRIADLKKVYKNRRLFDPKIVKPFVKYVRAM